MRASLADYLRDFGPPGEPGRRGAGSMGKGAIATADLDIFDAEPEPDVDAISDAAFRKGRLEAFAESAELHAAELEGERRRHRDEVAALRASYEQDYATTLATRFDQLSDLLVGTVGAQVAAVLAPFLNESVTARIVDELARAIAAGMVDGEVAEITVSGPRSLFTGLEQHFSDREVVFAFTETDDPDLDVDFNGTLFATRLGEWKEALKEALV